MMALVSAGFALGLAGAAHIATSRELGVVARPLASRVPPLTTYLLRLDGDPSDELTRFIERVQAIERPETPRPIRGRNPDPPEELMRSAERRVGNECVGTCRSLW